MSLERFKGITDSPERKSLPEDALCGELETPVQK